MKVLVTGGAGFIGSHLADKLIERGFQVILLDNLSSGSIANIDHLLGRDDVTFVKEDVLDIDACVEQIGAVDIVVHLSALVSVQESLADPRKSFRNNAEATALIFEFARKSKAKGLVYASSAAVYGAQTVMPVSENSNLSPMSPYAADKAYAEHLGSAYWHAFGLPSLGLRFFNVYGPRQDPTSPYSGVISKFIEACLNRRPLTIYGDGAQTRDFVYVGDLVMALAAGVDRLIEAPEEMGGALANIGSGIEQSVLALANLVTENCGSRESVLRYEHGKSGEVRNSRADIELAYELLGWRPVTKLADGINLTIRSCRAKREEDES